MNDDTMDSGPGDDVVNTFFVPLANPSLHDTNKYHQSAASTREREHPVSFPPEYSPNNNSLSPEKQQQQSSVRSNMARSAIVPAAQKGSPQMPGTRPESQNIQFQNSVNNNNNNNLSTNNYVSATTVGRSNNYKNMKNNEQDTPHDEQHFSDLPHYQ
jgi:hypothetical protein